MKLYYLIIPILLSLAGCTDRNYGSATWTLADDEICIRCGEAFVMPFKGGSADYSIDTERPEFVEVMAVSSANPFYPNQIDQSIVFRGRKVGSTEVKIKDNKTSAVVCYKLRVVKPYIALLGTVNTNPEYQDSLLTWDTNLYLSEDGRFLLTTFTDGMAVKPSLIARGKYEIEKAEDGSEMIKIMPEDQALGSKSYKIPDNGTLREILATWNIDRPDSDLDMCMLDAADGKGAARYWVTPSEHLPDGMGF